nr:glycosyltransferase family 2 protein [Enterococcus cecorum]
MLPKVSIIIPIYNTQEYVVDCVASAVNQTYQNLEIILVNDGTPDNSMLLIEQYFNDERILIINQENQGLSAARNTGIQYATGEYLFFLDSDDAIVDETIECLVSNITTNEPMIVMGNHLCAASIEQADFDAYPQEKQGKEITKKQMFDWMLTKVDYRNKVNSCTVWGKLYHHSIVDNHLFPIGRLHEDEFVNYLYLDEAEKIVFVDAPFYFYRDNSKGIIANRKIKNITDTFDAYFEKYQYFLHREYKRYIPQILLTLSELLDVIVSSIQFEQLSLEQQIYYYTIYKTITEDIS